MTDNQEFLNIKDLLLALVETVDSLNQEEIHISLLVNGVVVSGELVSQKLYLDAMSQLLGKNFPPAINESEHKTNESLTFIHLKNATVFGVNGEAMPNKNGVWWQVRLSSVDGFWIGKAHIKPPVYGSL
jgi:hypothetical protein